MNKALIYDWNRNTPPQQPPVVMLDDETLRDGLQSPSVRAPSIDQKLRILRLLDEIGVDTADVGLPEDSRQLRRAHCCQRRAADCRCVSACWAAD
jgi:isopropylmalate/homocitrate/citramalate synthase